MTELGIELERLGLSSYVERLVNEGFDTWDSVLDITESDLEYLGFKLGHRRVLQRAIATARGVPEDEPLPASFFYKAFSEGPVEDNDGTSSPRGQRQDTKPPGNQGKRKYRRHPKPDENAPERPPSAYVMFANHVREELKGQNLSFTEIAKMVGDRWKVLDPEQKQEYETEAQMAKEKYNAELAEYKKTDSYREYMQYLNEFRSRTSKDTSDVATSNADARSKRPKLDGLTGVTAGAGQTATDPAGHGSLGSASSSKRGHAGSISSTDSGNVSTLAMSNPSAYSSPGSYSTAHLPLGSQHTTSPPQQTYSHEQPMPGFHQYHGHNSHQQQQHPHHPSEPTTPPSHHNSYRDSNPRATHPQRMDNTHMAASSGVQPSLSYLRERRHSPVSSIPSMNRPRPPLQTSQQPQQGGPGFPRPIIRHTDTVSTQGSYSSSGSSSAPTMTPLTPLDNDHRSIHSHGSHASHSRALPLPTPNAIVSPSGYFDQRPGRMTPNLPPSPSSRALPPFPGQKAPSPRVPQLPPIVQRSPLLGTNRDTHQRPKDDREMATDP